MRLTKLACSALLGAAPLLGQLQFFNPDASWFSYPHAITTDSAGNTYVISNTSSNLGINLGLTAPKLDASQHVIYSFSFAPRGHRLQRRSIPRAA